MDLTPIFVFLGIGAFLWYIYGLYRQDEFISLNSVRKKPPSHGTPQLDIRREYYYVDERKKKK